MKILSFIGRIHPIKNLPTLVKAFSHAKIDGWMLRIVGPDQEGHLAELKSLCDSIGLTYIDETEIIRDENGRAVCPQPPKSVGRDDPIAPEKKEGNHHSSTSTLNFNSQPLVVFAGPKYDGELQQEYANADCFVLPSHSENFGSVVIESLAAGVPVITTKGTPWQELESNNCGKWVDVDEQAIENALVEMMSKSESERREMGANGRKLVESKYSWKAVCDTMIQGYTEVLNG